MDTTPGKESQTVSEAPNAGQETVTRPVTRTPSIIVGTIAVLVVALSLFYLLRPEPLLVQGEADATRLDIAARVDGRVKEIPVERGQNVPANAVLVSIDNPETVAKLEQMRAAMAVAEHSLPTCTRRNPGGSHRRAEGGTGARASRSRSGAKVSTHQPL